MIHLFRWSRDAEKIGWQTLERLPVNTIWEVPEGETWWIDLEQPTPEEEALVFQTFQPIHHLSLEDITKLKREPGRRAHFPKVEEFREYLFVITNPLQPDFLAHGERAALSLHRQTYTQLSAVMSGRVLITHHDEALPSVASTRQYVGRHLDAGERGPDYLFHLVLDAQVDEYAPIVDTIAASLDALENHMFRRPPDGLLSKLIRLKRRIVVLRKTLILEREVLMRLTRDEFELIGEREMVFYRNVYDHLVRYTELVEGAREMISDLLQSYLASMSNRMNAIMKVLAMISTVILPMSLIAGIYGMNFHYMPELQWRLGYPMALGLMGLTAIGALSFFYWKRWF